MPHFGKVFACEITKSRKLISTLCVKCNLNRRRYKYRERAIKLLKILKRLRLVFIVKQIQGIL